SDFSLFSSSNSCENPKFTATDRWFQRKMSTLTKQHLKIQKYARRIITRYYSCLEQTSPTGIDTYFRPVSKVSRLNKEWIMVHLEPMQLDDKQDVAMDLEQRTKQFIQLKGASISSIDAHPTDTGEGIIVLIIGCAEFEGEPMKYAQSVLLNIDELGEFYIHRDVLRFVDIEKTTYPDQIDQQLQKFDFLGAELRPRDLVVGRAFMDQYIEMTRAAPQNLDKFYFENSVVYRGNADGPLTSSTTLKGIQDLIGTQRMELSISSVDTYFSLKGLAIVILVTGMQNGKLFAESFLLTPKDSCYSYCVFQDIQRFFEPDQALPTASVPDTPTPPQDPAAPTATPSVPSVPTATPPVLSAPTATPPVPSAPTATPPVPAWATATRPVPAWPTAT
ncbi:hypothetical protein MKW98_022434, partial [Papaver atlanticum]